MELVGYLASVLMGLSLSMIGGGGSILTVPILVYLFQVNPVTATAYSLFIVGTTALVGGITHLKKGDVDLKTGFVFALPSFVGVYLVRAYVVPNLPDPVFSLAEVPISKSLLIMLVFSLLMLSASLAMVRTQPVTQPVELRANKIILSPTIKMLFVSLEGLVVGAVTGFVGAGGGFLIIPALVFFVGLPMKTAVGTSLFIIAAKSLLGFLGDLQQGLANEIQWTLLLSMSGLAILGSFVGVFIGKKVSEVQLKKGFGYFVLLMGIFILIDQIKRL